MATHIPRLFGLLLLVLSGANASNIYSGEAVTDRYWDCCKTDCSWPGRSNGSPQPPATCDADNNPLTNFNLGTACGGGPSFACANQSPWAVNDTFSYGYSSMFLEGHASDSWCCSCYELVFTSGPVKGKKMVIQAHNSGFDMVTANRFGLAVPGGNTSFAGACGRQYGLPNSVFGEENRGVGSIEDCDKFPEVLKEGCRWRFEWFMNADFPTANYTRVRCPAILTNRTGCIRQDENTIDQQGAGSRLANALSILGLTLSVTAALSLI